MTTLVTSDGNLVTSDPGAPMQLTASGRPALARSSSPLGLPLGPTALELIGTAGRMVSFDALYRSQPWVATAVHKLTRQVARLPLKVYRRDPDGARERVYTHPLVDLLQRPAPRCGPVQLKQWLVAPALVHGNSLLGMYRPAAGAPPTRLWPLDWRFLTPRQTETGGPIAYWESSEFEQQVYLDATDVVHVAWEAPSGRVGVSPLQQLGVPLRLEDAAQRYQEANFLNSARPSGAIEMPTGVTLDEALRAEMRADLERLYTGPENSGRPALLPGGLTWKQMAQTAKEAELIDQRHLTREEIAAVYDVPPPLVGILENATYSNVTELHRMLFTTVLGPWLTLIEERLQAQVIDPEPAFAGLFVEFDLAEVLKGDTLAETQALQLAIDCGLMSVNEARRVRNLPRVPDKKFDTPSSLAERQQKPQSASAPAPTGNPAPTT